MKTSLRLKLCIASVLLLAIFPFLDGAQHNKSKEYVRKNIGILSESALNKRQSNECDSGNAGSCTALADRMEYKSGQNGSAQTRELREKSRILLERACAEGSLEGCRNLGVLFAKLNDPSAAQGAFRKSCDKGDRQSCQKLATSLLGEGKSTSAVTHLQDSCSRGDSDSCIHARKILWELNLAGERVLAQYYSRCGDTTVAYAHDSNCNKSYRQECEAGDRDACFVMGWKIEKYMARHLVKACELGHTNACWLGAQSHFRTSKGEVVDFSFACNQGNPYACFDVGFAMWAENRNPKEINNKLFIRSCELGLPLGCSANKSPDEFRQALTTECNKYYGHYCQYAGKVSEWLGQETEALNSYDFGCKGGDRQSCNQLARLKKEAPSPVNLPSTNEKETKKPVNAPTPPAPISKVSESDFLDNTWRFILNLLDSKFALYFFGGLLLFGIFSYRKRIKTSSEIPWWREVYGGKAIGSVLISHLLVFATAFFFFNGMLVGHTLDRSFYAEYGISLDDLPTINTRFFQIGFAALTLLVAAGLFEKRKWTITLYALGVPFAFLFEALLIGPRYPMHVSSTLSSSSFFESFSFILVGIVLAFREWKESQKPQVKRGRVESFKSVSSSRAPVEPLEQVNLQPIPTPLPSPAQLSPLPLSERFEILELLGEGIYAKVYRVKERATGLEGAVKILSPHLAKDSVSLERFRREIQITRHLGNPQIVSIFDFVSSPEETYLLMEYVPGVNLKDYIRAKSPVSQESCLSIVGQILSVLKVCHEKGVLHRDLKPQNIIVMPTGKIKILDFGIARMTSLSDLTQTGTSLGSPEYMAPELFSGNVYDPRTDIYAIGIITYEMFAGTLPFQGDSLPVLYRKHVEEKVPSLIEKRKNLPTWVSDLVERMLEKRPFERYQCIDEIQEDLRNRQVLAKQLPTLRTRTCIQCGKRMLGEVPICMNCGQNIADLWSEADVDILISPTTDRQKLREFLAETFPEQEVSLFPTPLLASHCDRTTAQKIKQIASHKGVYVEFVPCGMVSSRVASLAGIIYLATIGISLAAPMNLAPSLLGLSRIPWTQVPNILFTLTLVSWVAFIPAIWLYRKSHRKPLLTNYQTDTWKTIAPVFAHFIPALKAEKSPAMENFLLKMVEKYYLMQPVLSGISSQDANRLSEILDLSARVAINLTEMDAFLSNPEFHLWGQRIQTLERALEDERDPEKRQAWVKQLSDLKDRIGEYFSIEEKFGKSMQSLSQLQFLFSQLTGKLLVYHTALDDADMIKLDDLSRELSHILDSNRELKATTRRAA